MFGVEFTGIVDDKVRFLEAFSKFLVSRSDHHVVHEQRVVRSGGDDADGLSVLRVPADEPIHDEDAVSVVEVVDGSLENQLELGSLHGSVDVAPPDLVVVFLVGHAHDPLVERHSAGLFAGVGGEGAGARETRRHGGGIGWQRGQSDFVVLRWSQVAVDRSRADAHGVESFTLNRVIEAPAELLRYSQHPKIVSC